MPPQRTERVRSLIVLALTSASFVLLAILCLVQWSALSVAGVTVSAVILLTGAAFGLVSSIHELLRLLRMPKAHAGQSKADRADQ